MAWLAGVPLPWLLGALIVSLALGAVGRRPTFPNSIRDLAFMLLAYFIGSTAGPEFFSSVTLWVPSVIASVVLIPAITFSSALVVRRLTDLTPDEALLCSVPGSLPFVVAASEEMGLRTHIVMLFQSVRLLTLTFLLPFALGFWGLHLSDGTSSDPNLGTGMSLSSLLEDVSGLSVVIQLGSLTFAFTCAKLAERLKIPAPTFIGPMMGVAIAKLAGVPLPDLPPVLLFGAQAALGWIMGSRFDVIPFRDLRQMAVASFAGLAVGIGVAGLGCLLLIATTDLNAKALVLSLAPGAIETVSAIALDQGVDPLFVSTHQIARLLSIPLIAAGMLIIGRRLLAFAGGAKGDGE